METIWQERSDRISKVGALRRGEKPGFFVDSLLASFV